MESIVTFDLPAGYEQVVLDVLTDRRHHTVQKLSRENRLETGTMMFLYLSEYRGENT